MTSLKTAVRAPVDGLQDRPTQATLATFDFKISAYGPDTHHAVSGTPDDLVLALCLRLRDRAPGH